jgi:Leucine carboxyl methyltransferase
MSDTEPLITHVSDTARWTALHRATESRRRDALFNDPFAERLAGQHGRAIVAGSPRTTRNGWWLIARTKIIDDTIIEAISDGCDRVLNLAAGLDTRPEVAWWMLDFGGPGLKKMMKRKWPAYRKMHRSSSHRKTGWPTSKSWAGERSRWSPH